MMRTAVFLCSLSCALFVGSLASARSEAPSLSTEDSVANVMVEAERAEEAAELGPHVGVMSIMSSNVNFDGDAAFDMLILQGELHWTSPAWRFVAHPRVKVRPVGTDNDSVSVFFQEVFGSYRQGALAEFKVGKIYERFGRMWDYGVYGPLVGNTDLKLRPDIGFSLEGSPELQANLTLDYALQYFVVDGQSLRVVNGYSLERNARHSNIVVARVAPSWRVDDVGTLAFGLSGKRHTSYGSDVNGHQVLTMAADMSFNRGPLDAFFEVGYQNGSSAALGGSGNNYSTADSIDPYTYMWGGASYDIAQVNVRFNVSASFYRDAPQSVEVLYQPGLGYFFGDKRNLQVAVEGAFWSSTNPMARAESAPGWRERAVYLVAVGQI